MLVLPVCAIQEVSSRTHCSATKNSRLARFEVGGIGNERVERALCIKVASMSFGSRVLPEMKVRS